MRARLLVCVALAGCGGGAPAHHDRETPLPPGVRPIGPGPRYRPSLTGRVKVQDCRARLGRRVGVHLELFAGRFVVLFPAGIGTEPPRRLLGGRIERARCYGPVATIDPTGLVLLRPGTRATVGDVFDVWGRRFGAGFRGRVRTWVNGVERQGDPQAIPLRRHDEIVIEIGGYVVPHAAYTFPRGY